MKKISTSTTGSNAALRFATVACLCTVFLLASCSTAPTTKGPLEPFGPAGVTSAAVEGQRYALLVGINEFEDEKFNDLRFAAADAKALSEALGGFDETITLTTRESTSRAAILAAMARLQEKVDSRRDVIFVYFSTHGTLARKPGGRLERYLVASDTRLDIVSATGIAVEDILARLDATPSRRTALVLATCHSGSGKSQITDELSRALAGEKSARLPPLEQVSEASVVLSASAFRETAREEPTLGHDVYTHFLLQALQEGDRDGDGAVTISEAHDWARQRTYAYTEGAQRPTAWSAILGQDPIVLAGERSRKGRPVVYSYQPSADGLEVSVDGQTKGTLPGGVVLEPGSHELELRESGSGRVVWRGNVDLEAGERIEAASLVPPGRSWGFQLDGGVFSPLSATTREELFPATWAVGARASLVNVPWTSTWLELRGTIFGADSSLTAFGATLPYELRGGHVELGAGKLWPLGNSFRFGAGADIGVLWASRTFDTDTFQDEESLRGMTASALTELDWRPFRRFRLNLRLDAGFLRASLGNETGPHPYGRLMLGLGTEL